MDIQLLIGFIGVFLVGGSIVYVGYAFAKMAQESLNRLKEEELKKAT